MLAQFLFKKNQMPGKEIDVLMQIWANSLPGNDDPPFANHSDLYATIDATTVGGAPWQSFSISYAGDIPEEREIPPWMLAAYDVWFRDPRLVLQNQLRNPSFKNQFDYAPFQKYNKNGEREWQDFMSANWGYQQAVSVCASLVDSILTIDRILLPRTRRLMARSLFPSFWAAIRPQCRSRLDKMNITLCIYQTAIYTTVFAVHTGRESASLRSFRYPRVSPASAFILSIVLTMSALPLPQSRSKVSER